MPPLLKEDIMSLMEPNLLRQRGNPARSKERVKTIRLRLTIAKRLKEAQENAECLQL